jgi:putative sigma-54 modulation protein
MKVNIQSIAFTLKKEVNDFIQGKVEKLRRFCSGIINIEVCLKVDRSVTRNNKICKIRVVIPGYDLVSSAQAKSFQAAAAQAVNALERQIEKRKKKELASRVQFGNF